MPIKQHATKTTNPITSYKALFFFIPIINMPIEIIVPIRKITIIVMIFTINPVYSIY